MIPQYRPLIDRESLAKEVSEYILGDGYFTEYKKTEEFEKSLAEFLGVRYCFALNNGTISLSLALLAGGVKPGDRVLIPNITMIATCNAVKLIGAVPVLIDLDQYTMCMDLDIARTEIARFTKNPITAVIYVTLNGRKHHLHEYFEFESFCRKNGVLLVEDNAQSLGSKNDDYSMISCPVGGIGSFSFSMPKIITTGQGGCLVTNDSALATRIKQLKDFGRTAGGIDIHEEFGINCKFTEIQAIMGLNQMRTIKERVEKKRDIYAKYAITLHKLGIGQHVDIRHFPDTHTPWFVDIYLKEKGKLQLFLKENKIGTRDVYPALDTQLCNESLFYHYYEAGISHNVAKEGLWLPSSLDLEDIEIEYICQKIKEFYERT